MRSIPSSPTGRCAGSLLGLLLAVAYSTDCRADGAFLWRRGANLREPDQKAILHWADGRETLFLQVSYQGAPDSFCWVVPTPSRPEVEAWQGDADPFDELSRTMQRRELSAGYWGTHGITVEERKTTGIYDVAVLRGTSGSALREWLVHNGYRFPEEGVPLLEAYAGEKAWFVAANVRPESLTQEVREQMRSGELQPLLLRFSADPCIYPLRISALNRGKTTVHLYVLSEAPLCPDESWDPDSMGFEDNFVRYAREGWDPTYGTWKPLSGSELPAVYDALGLPRDGRRYLCLYAVQLAPEDMTRDIDLVAFDPVVYWTALLEADQDDVVLDPLELRYWSLRSRRKSFYTTALSVLQERGLDVLPTYARAANAELRCAVARHPETAPETLLLLGADTEYWIRKEVAGHPNAPADLLLRLADDVREVRSAVARNPNCPPDLLAVLAADKVADGRAGVASRRDVPAGLLIQLALDDEPEVRTAAASNPALPSDWLAALAEDRNDKVREAVARNPSTPPEILGKLAWDPAAEVAKAVLSNPHTPERILRIFAEHPNRGSIARSELRRREPAASRSGSDQ